MRKAIWLTAVTVLLVGAATQTEAQWFQHGADIDGEAAGDESGCSVSLSADGNTIAVGALYNGVGNTGHVRVFEWNYGTVSWDQLGSDIDGESAWDWFGNSVSLSQAGNHIAIGGYGNDDNGTLSGHTRIFEWNSGTANWDQLGSDIDGEATDDHSGISVSLSANGSIVAIGARHNDGNGSNSGHVRLYEWNSGSASWDQLGSDIDGEATEDNSGYSVSLSADGTLVAIGAYSNSGNGTQSGQTRIFEWNSGTASWDQLGSDIDGEVTGDYSGIAVALSAEGEVVAIGAHGNDGGGTDAGHVRIYEWNSGSASWDQLGSDIDGEAAGDYTGVAVALSAEGDLVAIGANNNDGNGSNSGHVRLYEWNSGTASWDQLGSDIDGEAAGDGMGISVALSADGDQVAIGARLNDGNGNNAGHVRVYEWSPDLFFSEYIEGSSYNKALEIYNCTGSAVDLVSGSYSIEIYSNGNTTPSSTIHLTGMVNNGDVYVVADDGADAAILAEADQTSGVSFFNGDDAVVLKKDGTIIDVVGQIGVDPGSEWGSGDTSTQDNTIRRKVDICLGDSNPEDAFDPVLEWDGYANDTFDGLGSHIPTLDNLLLTASSVDETTDDDLTCSYDLAGGAVTAAVAWHKNSAPIMELHLPFEGGTTNAPDDFSGNSNPVSTYGDPVWQMHGGHDGHGAYEFSGDHFDAGHTFPTLSSYTKTAWVYRTGTSYNNIIAGYTHALHNHCFKVNPDGLLNAGHSAGSAHVIDTVPLLGSTWYFTAVTYDYDSREMILYRDGAEVDRETISVTYQDVTDSGLLVGAMDFNYKWQGMLDDIRIYDYVLSPEQLATMAGRASETMVSEETETGETWHCVVTPFSTTEKGDAETSNSITIQPPALSAPLITSTAVTTGAVWQPYSYDVEADGNPDPTFSLLTNPTGMTIAPATGVIEWAPDSNGDFNVTVRAENSEGHDDQLYLIHVPLPDCQISGLDLTSTSGSDFSTDDLSASFDLSGTATTAAVAWEIDGIPMMEFFLPFEGGGDQTLRDFSGNQVPVTTFGDPTWLPTGGHDGQGAYEFDGNDYLIPQAVFPTLSSYTKTAWIYRTGDSYNGIISSEVHGAGGGHCFRVPPSGHLDAGQNGDWSRVVDPGLIDPVTWYFVVVTFEYSTGEMILYKDGVSVDSAILDVLDRDVTDPIVYVGATQHSFQWEGVIDDPRVYARALSPEQITALHGSRAVSTIASPETSMGEVWQASVTPFTDSEAGMTYDSNSLTIQPVPPAIVSIPVTAASAGSLYSYDVDATGDPVPTYSLALFPTGMTIDPISGLIQWTPTAGGNYDVIVRATNYLDQDDQPFVIQVVAPTIENLGLTSTSGNNLTEDDLTCSYDLAGDAVSAAVAWQKNGAPLMELHLPFEGGEATAPNDFSGNSHPVSTYGAPVWQMNGGHDGHGAYEFNGYDHFDAGSTFPTSSSYTKTAWVYRTGTSYNNIVAGYTHAANNHCFKVHPNQMLNAGHSGGSAHVSDDTALLPNTWYFVAVTFDYSTGEMILYKNSEEVDRTILDESLRNVSDAGLLIGAMTVNNNWRWRGMLDDIRIYDYVLSPEQLVAMAGRASETIVSQETTLGEQWQARVTPFSTSGNGPEDISNTLTISPPAYGFEVTQSAQYDLISVTHGTGYRFQTDIICTMLDGTGSYHEVEVDIDYDPAYLTVSGVTQNLGIGSMLFNDEPVSGLLNVMLTITGSYDPPGDEELFTIHFASDDLATENIVPGTDLVLDTVELRTLTGLPIQCDVGSDLNIRLDDSGPTPFDATFPTLNCLNSDFLVGTSIVDNTELEQIDYSFDGISWIALVTGISGASYDLDVPLSITGLADETDHTVYLRAYDEVGNSTDSTPSSWLFHLDQTAPVAVTDLQVTPWPVEPRDQLRCRLTWSNSNSGDSYQLWRARRLTYPYCGGMADPSSWDTDYIHLEDIPGTTTEWIDESWTGDTDESRGVCDYRLVQVDCINTAAPSNIASATNYILGDVVANDGVIATADLIPFADAYGTEVESGVTDELDVGPTDDWSSYGIPEIDGLIEFEDLIIFALNYGTDGPSIPVSSFGEQRDKSTPATDVEMIVTLEDAEVGYQLTLTGDLKGFSARLQTARQLESAIATGYTVMTYRDVDFWVIDAIALDGLIADGTAIALEFEGEGDLELTTAEGRDSWNQPVTLTVENNLAENLPTVFMLAQNYPNPFNPVTTINYDLAATVPVQLLVYNTLGQQVANLVDGTQPAGRYSVSFDGSRLASGLYFYSLQAGEFNDLQKMLLVK